MFDVFCPNCGHFTHLEESDLGVRKCFCGHVFTSDDIDGESFDFDSDIVTDEDDF